MATRSFSQHGWLHVLACAIPLCLASMSVFSASERSPDSTSTDARFLFVQAMEERDNGDLHRAINSFRLILQEHPHLHRARLELAVAYYQALNFAEARSQAEQVLNDPATPESVKGRLNAFIELLNETSRTHRWTPNISFGMTADSNVNAGPDNDTFTMPGGSLTLVPEATSRSDMGLEVSGGVTHRYLAPKTLPVLGKDAAMIWFSRANLHSIRYFDEDDFNLDVLTLTTGPSLIVARQWRAGINLLVEQSRLDGDSYLRTIGLNPTLTWQRPQHRDEISADMLIQNRDYQLAGSDGRDSTYLALGGAYRRVLNDDRFAAQLRGDLYSEDASNNQLSNTGVRLGVNGSMQLDKQTALLARASVQSDRYSKVNQTFQKKRSDQQLRLVIGGSYTFDERIPYLHGWTAEGNLAYTNHSSNIGVYEYDRTILTVRLGRSF